MNQFIEFLEEHARFESVKEFYGILVGHLAKPHNLRLIRKGGDFKGSKVGRGRFYATNSRRVVFSDNEPAVWINAQLWVNKAPWLNEPLESLVLSKQLPVAHWGAKEESDGCFLLQQVFRPWGDFELKHAFDTRSRKQGLNKDLDKLSAREMDALCIRLLHPINHSFFPTEYKQLPEETGDPRYQLVAAHYAKSRLPKIFAEFCELAMVPDAIDWENVRSDYGLAMPVSTSGAKAEAGLQSTGQRRQEGAQSQDNLVCRLRADKQLATGASRITGNDTSNRENSQTIAENRLHKPFSIHIQWKDNKEATPYLVGNYELDLARLLEGKYVKQEPSGSQAGAKRENPAENSARRRRFLHPSK